MLLTTRSQTAHRPNKVNTMMLALRAGGFTFCRCGRSAATASSYYFSSTIKSLFSSSSSSSSSSQQRRQQQPRQQLWQQQRQRDKNSRNNNTNYNNNNDDYTSGGGGGNNSNNNNNTNNDNKQSFDKAIFQVGEWDPDTRTNPLYRPKYPGTPRIISADDFARRPTVGFSGDFKSLEDGMVVLSWLDHKQQRDIYDLYVKMLLQSEKVNATTTSHEYVVRKIAAQVRLTEERVAAVIQLQHNEEQMRQAGIELCDDLAEHYDKGIAAEFAAAYRMQRGSKEVTRQPPATFVEDPVGVAGLQDSKHYVQVDDLIQINENDEHDAELQRAKNIIENHRYIEDHDYDTIPIPLDKNCKIMVKQAAQMPNSEMDEIVQRQRQKKAAAPPLYRQRTKNPRPRWKFVCQAVDSRKEIYTNNCIKNTIVEQDGIVRPATMADIRQTSWKPVRHVKEFTYHGVKQAWLNRIHRNRIDGWGYARVKPPPPSATPTAAVPPNATPTPTTTTTTTSDQQDTN